jgi:hypothetical protein
MSWREARFSEVLVSNVPGFAHGDIAVARTGWQTFALSDGRGLRWIPDWKIQRAIRQSPPTLVRLHSEFGHQPTPTLLLGGDEACVNPGEPASHHPPNPRARLRRTNFWILPVAVVGKAPNTTDFGALKCAS